MEWIIVLIVLFIADFLKNYSQKNKKENLYKYPVSEIEKNYTRLVEEKKRKKESEEKKEKLKLNNNLRNTHYENYHSKHNENELLPSSNYNENSILESYKNDWNEIKDILQKNKIDFLYHFTDKSNIPTIRIMGGLFSWYELDKLGVSIPCPGGNSLSRSLDTKKNLQNYVRLSFVENHPMLYFAQKENRIKTPFILKINTDVIFNKKTLYSDCNATSNYCQIGDDINTFKKINFDLIKSGKWNGEEEKRYLQAEIMVEKFIPLKYITNI